MSTLAVRLELGCLMVPVWARPAEPTGERAIRLAQIREHSRIGRLADAPWVASQPHQKQTHTGRHNGGKGRPRTHTPAEERRIQRMADRGMSRPQIAAATGISKSGVKYSLTHPRRA